MIDNPDRRVCREHQESHTQQSQYGSGGPCKPTERRSNEGQEWKEGKKISRLNPCGVWISRRSPEYIGGQDDSYGQTGCRQAAQKKVRKDHLLTVQQDQNKDRHRQASRKNVEP